jgi:hypothetical protein
MTDAQAEKSALSQGTFRDLGLTFFSPVVQRFPRRGGNYNNGGNIGLGYENCNNPRSNANRNYGARPRSRRQKKRCTAMHRQPTNRTGGVRSLPGSKMPGQ